MKRLIVDEGFILVEGTCPLGEEKKDGCCGKIEMVKVGDFFV